MKTATCCDCGATYDADSVDSVVRDEPGHPCMDPFEDALDLCPGDEVPAGRCSRLRAHEGGGDPEPCGMACYLDDDHVTARAPISAPGSTLEELENDLAALDMLLRLAEYGSRQFEIAAEWSKRMEEAGEHFEHETVADEVDEEVDEEHAHDIARLYSNGAGAFEPSAVVVWLKEKIAETENTIAGLDGSGPPVTRSTVVVEVEGGIVQGFFADAPARLIVLDTDQPDPENARTVHTGGNRYTYVYELDSPGDPQDRESVAESERMLAEADDRERAEIAREREAEPSPGVEP